MSLPVEGNGDADGLARGPVFPFSSSAEDEDDEELLSFFFFFSFFSLFFLSFFFLPFVFLDASDASSSILFFYEVKPCFFINLITRITKKPCQPSFICETQRRGQESRNLWPMLTNAKQHLRVENTC